ncbi:hypothetical protein HNY73_013488 [Argiope bruennichi]|uniref:Uncharacterized protein n=1 Tax=Argiope bruennichi TaxID=94029 RepID=A0A8T0F2Y6_ARGBR|nr:hypothetical protein HNY73_013488 [Argiope bruennichi]
MKRAEKVNCSFRRLDQDESNRTEERIYSTLRRWSSNSEISLGCKIINQNIYVTSKISAFQSRRPNMMHLCTGHKRWEQCIVFLKAPDWQLYQENDFKRRRLE